MTKHFFRYMKMFLYFTVLYDLEKFILMAIHFCQNAHQHRETARVYHVINFSRNLINPFIPQHTAPEVKVIYKKMDFFLGKIS